MSNRKPIVVVGSINLDLVTNVDRIPSAGETVHSNQFQMHPGGKGANQAVAVARLGYPVRMVGMLGSDGFGKRLRSHLSAAGVDIGGVGEANATSGVAIVVVTPNGQNSIIVSPGANADVSPDYIDRHTDVIRGASIVLTQLEIPLPTVDHLAGLCQRAGVPLMLDPAPAQSLPAELLQKIDWITPNEVEASFYTPDQTATGASDRVARSLLTQGPRGVVLKMGSRGAYLATGGTGIHLSPVSVHVVDTTAAGDAFNGAFAVGLQLGKSPLESARFAVVASAISVTRPGAQPSMPRMEEVQAMLDRGSLQDSNDSGKRVV